VVEKSAPPPIAGMQEPRRHSSRWKRAGHIGGLALVHACWFGDAAAGPLRASHLRFTPDPFGFGAVAFACELKNVGSKPLPADSSRERSRYTFRVSADATGQSWGSGWFLVPPLAPHQEVTVTSTVAMIPDSISARQITQVTTTVFIDEGNEVPKARKMRYYRWRSGSFHPLPEEYAARPTSQEPPAWQSTAPQSDTTSVRTMRTAANEPAYERFTAAMAPRDPAGRSRSPGVMPGRRAQSEDWVAPHLACPGAWGRFKVRYRSGSPDSGATTVRR